MFGDLSSSKKHNSASPESCTQKWILNRQSVDHDGSLKQVPPLLCGEEGRKHLLGSLLSSPGSLHLLLANCVSRAEETFNDTLGRNLFEIL